MRLLRGDLAIVAGLLSLLAAVSLTAPRWSRWLSKTLAEDGEPPAERARPVAAPAPAKKISVKLYFESAREPALVAEDREVPFAGDLAGQLRALVEALIHGSEAGQLAPLPPETRVLGVFVTPAGVAYVDLSGEAAGAAAGSLGERLSVYALVDSITANFPAVKRVQILLDDHPIETLGGHLDLSRPLAPDMTLVAAALVPPQSEGPEPASTALPALPEASPAPAPRGSR